jgi:hypothetical protein
LSLIVLQIHELSVETVVGMNVHSAVHGGESGFALQDLHVADLTPIIHDQKVPRRRIIEGINLPRGVLGA